MQTDIRSVIMHEFKRVAEEQDKHIAELRDDLPLLASGLDSLCFAIVVVRLEVALGYDPFSSEEATDFPVTFGAFVAAYEHAAV